MNAIKDSLKSLRASFETVPFLKFMVNAGVYIFAAGGLLWLLAGFIPAVTYGFGYGALFFKSLLATLGRVLIVAGLFCAVLKREELISMIVCAAISVGALVIAILEAAALRYFPGFEAWFFFLLFGGLAVLIFLMGDKMKEFRTQAKQNADARAQQRAAAQAAAAQVAAQQAAAQQQVQLIECPNCKGPVPINVPTCPNCGAPNPAMQYQQQAPPQAPPAPAQAAPPQAPPMAPPVQASQAPPAPQAPEAPEVPETPDIPDVPAPEAQATKKCVACGAELSANAAFCGQCGAKQ